MRFFRRRPRHPVLLLCFAVDDDFLSHVLLPEAPRLRLQPPAHPVQVLAALPRGCRLVLPALNLTEPWRVLPAVTELRAALEQRGIRLLNAWVEDQGKHHLQARLRRLGLPSAEATADGDPDEPLLVKSELNSGALVERRLSPAQRAALGLAPVAERVPTRDAYPQLPRRQIPPDWFADPALMIERFVQRQDRLCFRLFQAGRHGFLISRRSERPVARTANAEMAATYPLTSGPTGWQTTVAMPAYLPALLAAAWQVTQDSGLDVGALDIVVSDAGLPYVVDLNVTPFHGILRQEQAMNQHLRAGLDVD